MKNKIKDILGYVFIGAIILYCILSYPWLVSVNEYGETVCKDFFGRVSRCDR